MAPQRSSAGARARVCLLRLIETRVHGYALVIHRLSSSGVDLGMFFAQAR